MIVSCRRRFAKSRDECLLSDITPTATCLGLISVTMLLLLLKCVNGGAMFVDTTVTVNFTCTGPADKFPPTWFVNRRVAATVGDCHRFESRSTGDQNFSVTLTLNGNHDTCNTFDVHCRIFIAPQFLYIHNTTLVVYQDHLPPPENVHIIELVNASMIKWTPPYSAINNDNMYVDPHITQYTVYITDNYTGNIVTENVTETQFTFDTSEDGLCPTYRVSAWNGCEGKLSNPMQESAPKVPRNVTPENVSISVTEPNILLIRIDVDTVCTSRIPKFFLITLMTYDGGTLNEARQHQPGQPVANFNISLPQSMAVYPSVHVRISAGNSAGMSAPSDTVEVDFSGASTESTVSTAAVSTVASTASVSGGNTQQEDRTTFIVIISGVIAVIGGVLIGAATVGIIGWRKYKRRNSKVKDQTDNYYSTSPSISGPPLHKPPVNEVVYATHQQTTSRPVVPEVQTLVSDSAPSSPSTNSDRSDHSSEQLLPPSPSAPTASPHLLYAQVNVQQTQVPPPANDDHVQYAQIKQQDKM